MLSNIKSTSHHLFDLFIIYSKRNAVTSIDYLYPKSKSSDGRVKSAQQFCFPYQFESANSVEEFLFSILDKDGNRTFCFSRLNADRDECLCLIAPFPFFMFYRNSLLRMSNIRCNGRSEHHQKLLEKLLTSLYEIPVSASQQNLHVSVSLMPDDCDLVDNVQIHHGLPNLMKDRNFQLYYSRLQPHVMISVFIAMLFERRILFTSSSIGWLTSSIFAAVSLLYPFKWQHVFVPLLADCESLLTCPTGPMPYIIGIPRQLMAKVNGDLGDVMLVDLDNRTVEFTEGLLSCDDDPNSPLLPPEIQNRLYASLLAVEKRKNISDDMFARQFLRAIIALISDFKLSIVYDDGEPKFVPGKFINANESFSKSCAQLLKTQLFEQFKQEKIAELKSSTSSDEIFEDELKLYFDKVGRRDPLSGIRQLTHDSRDFFDGIKNRIKPKKQKLTKISSASNVRDNETDANVIPVGNSFSALSIEVPNEGGISKPSSGSSKSPSVRFVASEKGEGTIAVINDVVNASVGAESAVVHRPPPDAEINLISFDTEPSRLTVDEVTFDPLEEKSSSSNVIKSNAGRSFWYADQMAGLSSFVPPALSAPYHRSTWQPGYPQPIPIVHHNALSPRTNSLLENYQFPSKRSSFLLAPNSNDDFIDDPQKRALTDDLIQL